MKQKQNAILTIAVGPYLKVWEKTKSYFEAYADKVNADLIVIQDFDSGEFPSPHWLKLAIHHFLHKQYSRLIYFDADMIIRPDCPDLFEIVPEEKLGIFNEGKFVPRAIALHEAKLKLGDLPEWDGMSYYNTGVMVISQDHRHIFAPIEKIPHLRFAFGEQTFLNHRIIQGKVPIAELDYRFNRMSLMNKWLGVSRLDSFVVHYAGSPNIEAMLKAIDSDGEQWRKDAPDYHYEPCFFINCGGGLGDQACAEPALRYLSETLYPRAEIWVLTNYPRLFKHLRVKAFQDTPDILRPAIFEVDTHPSPTTPLRKYLSHLFSHGVDYNSIAILKRILPNWEKQIKIAVEPEDFAEVGDVDLDVIIHPGKGWAINTFPPEWWMKIINDLKQHNFKIGLIGKSLTGLSGTHGVLDFPAPREVVYFRDKLSLGGLLAIISKTDTLISNDSAPIHLAGAFDNNIILIPTCKHSHHLLPWRNGSQNYKAVAICKRLLNEDIPMYPNQIFYTFNPFKGPIHDYIPEAEEVISAALNMGRKRFSHKEFLPAQLSVG